MRGRTTFMDVVLVIVIGIFVLLGIKRIKGNKETRNQSEYDRIMSMIDELISKPSLNDDERYKLNMLEKMMDRFK
jgi:hypothetical protein